MSMTVSFECKSEVGDVRSMMEKGMRHEAGIM
jgi:hypothetical protein